MPAEVPRDSREVVTFDATVYSLETVKKAAYRLMNRFSTEIRQADQEIVCTLNFKSATPGEIARSIDEFKKEILDQDLRQSIGTETASMRNAILAIAFSSSTLQGHE
jgi:His-Xaa-Ser system protein HxsD